tara:strand:+ start:586 stop:855 length:270 start_codon:yes stop_codon:yes gene_type:complete
MLPCLNKKLFGVDCLGCGMQRSASLIVHGEFTAAFNMYPAIYTLIVLLGFIIVNAFKNYKHGNKIILILAVLNAIIMISSYMIKLFFNQ